MSKLYWSLNSHYDIPDLQLHDIAKVEVRNSERIGGISSTRTRKLVFFKKEIQKVKGRLGRTTEKEVFVEVFSTTIFHEGDTLPVVVPTTQEV